MLHSCFGHLKDESSSGITFVGVCCVSEGGAGDCG